MHFKNPRSPFSNKIKLGGSAGTSPENTVSPSIARVGNSIICNKGTWTGTPTITYSYVFIRSNDGGINFTVVQSGASDTYNLVIGDNLGLVRCNVLGNNGIGGNVFSASNDLNVGQLLPVNSVAPAISGNRFVSQTLSGTDGTWTNAVSYSYQWQRSTDGGTSWSDISGSTSATYVAAVADMNNRIRRRVRAANSFGNADAFSGNLQIVYTVLDGYSNSAFLTDFRLQRGAYFGNNLVEILRTSDSSLLNIGHDSNGEIDIAAAITHARAVNRVIQSQTFSNASWSKLNTSIISTNNTAPDATNTATLLEMAAIYGVIQQNEQNTLIPAVAVCNPTGNYCLSIYVKKVNRNLIRLNNGVSQFVFNLDAPSGNFQDVGNGWYRIWISATGANVTNFRIQGHDGGAIGDRFLFWGAQWNLGTTPTAYQPTLTSPSGFARIRTYYDHSTNSRNAVNSTLSGQDFIVVDGQSIAENGQIVAEKYDSTHSGSFQYTIASFSLGANSTVYDKNKRLATNQYTSLGNPLHYEHGTQGIGISDPGTYNNMLAVNNLFKVAVFNRAFPNGQVFRRNIVSGTWDTGTLATNLASNNPSVARIKNDFFNTGGRAKTRGLIIFLASHDLSTMQAISLLI